MTEQRQGVLWSGLEIIPGAAEAIEYLKKVDKQIIFVTNNSTESRSTQQLRFQSMSIPATEAQIFTSAYSTAIYLSQVLRLPAPRNKVFVLGGVGIKYELESVGLRTLDGTDDTFNKDMTIEDFEAISSGSALDEDVGAVVVGMDMKFNYLENDSKQV